MAREQLLRAGSVLAQGLPVHMYVYVCVHLQLGVGEV